MYPFFRTSHELLCQRTKRLLKDFARCKDKIAVEKKHSDEYYTINIPHENRNRVIRYVIVIRMNENTLLCKMFIQVNALNGVPLYTMYHELTTIQANFKFSTPLRGLDLEFTRFLNGLGLAAFKQVEEIILKVEALVQTQVKKIKRN